MKVRVFVRDIYICKGKAPFIRVSPSERVAMADLPCLVHCALHGNLNLAFSPLARIPLLLKMLFKQVAYAISASCSVFLSSMYLRLYMLFNFYFPSANLSYYRSVSTKN